MAIVFGKSPTRLSTALLVPAFLCAVGATGCKSRNFNAGQDRPDAAVNVKLDTASKPAGTHALVINLFSKDIGLENPDDLVEVDKRSAQGAKSFQGFRGLGYETSKVWTNSAKYARKSIRYFAARSAKEGSSFVLAINGHGKGEGDNCEVRGELGFDEVKQDIAAALGDAKLSRLVLVLSTCAPDVWLNGLKLATSEHGAFSGRIDSTLVLASSAAAASNPSSGTADSGNPVVPGGLLEAVADTLRVDLKVLTTTATVQNFLDALKKRHPALTSAILPEGSRLASEKVIAPKDELADYKPTLWSDPDGTNDFTAQIRSKDSEDSEDSKGSKGSKGSIDNAGSQTTLSLGGGQAAVRVGVVGKEGGIRSSQTYVVTLKTRNGESGGSVLSAARTAAHGLLDKTGAIGYSTRTFGLTMMRNSAFAPVAYGENRLTAVETLGDY